MVREPVRCVLRIHIREGFIMSATPPTWQPLDLSLLESHIHDCARSRGPFHGVHCASEWLHRLMAPRVTSCLMLALLLWLALV